MRLIGCDLPTFELFIFFITTRTFPDFVAPTRGKILDRAVSANVQAQLVRAWALGDYLGMPSFQDQAMHSLLDYLEVDSILVSTIEMIFAMGSADSALRNVAVSECVWAQVFDEAYSRSEMK